MEGPQGKNDGSVQGKSYFSCAENHGMFVRPTQIKVIAYHSLVPQPTCSRFMSVGVIATPEHFYFLLSKVCDSKQNSPGRSSKTPSRFEFRFLTNFSSHTHSFITLNQNRMLYSFQNFSSPHIDLICIILSQMLLLLCSIQRENSSLSSRGGSKTPTSATARQKSDLSTPRYFP